MSRFHSYLYKTLIRNLALLVSSKVDPIFLNLKPTCFSLPRMSFPKNTNI